VTTAGTSKSYDSLFGSFGLRENPFHASPDPYFLFSGPAYENAIAELMFGIESRRGLHVLTGEAGTGKTTLLRYFLQWLNDRHFSSSYVFHTHLSSAELFELVLRDFGVAVDSTKKTDLLATLQQWLEARQAIGDIPVLIIDEAQALSLRTLSELRLLLNLENKRGKLLQMILAGQLELVDKLYRPELSALRQRMMVHCRLPLLTLADTADYINARLRGAGATDPQIFPLETVQTLYSYARGIPRITNLLCERAMMCAYADRQTRVSPVNVRKMAAEYDLEGEADPCTTIDLPLRPTEMNPPRSVEIQEPPQSTVIAENAVTVSTEPAPNAATLALPAASPQPAGAFASAPELASAVASAPASPQQSEKSSENFIVEFRLASDQGEESPKIVNGFEWRKSRFEIAFSGYWRDVTTSFRRDARDLYQSVAPKLKSFTQNIHLPQLHISRNLFGRVANWLRMPMHTGHARTSRSAVPPPRAAKS
jgi:general secretion pathway protein A